MFVSFLKSPYEAKQLRKTCTFINDNFQKWHNELDYSIKIEVNVENDGYGSGNKTGYNGSFSMF